MMLGEARAPLVPLAALAHRLFDGLVNMAHVLLQLGPRLERLGALRGTTARRWRPGRRCKSAPSRSSVISSCSVISQANADIDLCKLHVLLNLALSPRCRIFKHNTSPHSDRTPQKQSFDRTFILKLYQHTYM